MQSDTTKIEPPGPEHRPTFFGTFLETFVGGLLLIIGVCFLVAIVWSGVFPLIVPAVACLWIALALLRDGSGKGDVEHDFDFESEFDKDSFYAPEFRASSSNIYHQHYKEFVAPPD